MTMDPSVKAAVEAFIERESLPAGYFDTVRQWYLPLAEQLLQNIAGHSGSYVVGVSGCQGSGKSTLARLLISLMGEMAGLRGIELSIDDFYLTRDERRRLSREVHPLLATRGVPGTHDVSLAIDTVRALRQSGRVAIPRFDKAVDDRRAPDRWPVVQAPVDVIVLEGWCVGVTPQPDEALRAPVNALEAEEDPRGIWRGYVNRHLAGEYQRLFGLIDYLVMLRAPDFDSVYHWRRNQEEQLARQTGERAGSRVMSPAQLERFIGHYERLTRHALAHLPERADAVLQLTGDQTVETARQRAP